MTPNQRKFYYFPEWNRCAKANRWTMANGRLVADLDTQAAERISSPAFEERFKAIELAESFAVAAHRAVTADDLRHACNHIASGGKTVHSEDMSQTAITLAVRLFRLLTDPDNLQAVMDWTDPAEADRKDYADYVGRVNSPAVLVAISRNAWGTSDWRSQGMDQLRWLNQQASRSGRPRRKQARQPF